MAGLAGLGDIEEIEPHLYKHALERGDMQCSAVRIMYSLFHASCSLRSVSRWWTNAVARSKGPIHITCKSLSKFQSFRFSDLAAVLLRFSFLLS